MAEIASNNKIIAKNTMFLTIRMLFVLAISLYTSRIILAALGIEDFGIYNVVGGFVSMFSFLNNAMTTGIQRFYNVELGKNGVDGANRVYVASIFSQITLAVIIFVLTETVGLWYIYNKMVIPDTRFDAAVFIFHFSVISLLINIISVPYSGAIMAHEKMDYFAFVSILDALLKLAIALVIPYLSRDKLITYGFLVFLISVIDFLLYAIYAKVKFPEIHFVRTFNKDIFINLVTFSGWNVFGKLAIMLKEQGLNMLLNLFFGPVVNAARGIAFQVNNALLGFVNNINVAVKPQLTQSYAQGNKKRTFSLMFSISKLCYITLLCLAIPVCIEIDYILCFWLGNNIPEYTNIFIVIVIATAFINNLNAPVSFVIHAIGQMKKYQIVTSIIELLILPVAYIILKSGGEPWLAFLVAFIFVVITQVASLIILKELEDYSIQSYLLSVICPLLIVSIGSILISYTISYILPSSFLRLCIVTLTSFLITITLSYQVALNSNEKLMIKKIIVDKFKLVH